MKLQGDQSLGPSPSSREHHAGAGADAAHAPRHGEKHKRLVKTTATWLLRMRCRRFSSLNSAAGF